VEGPFEIPIKREKMKKKKREKMEGFLGKIGRGTNN
jgi:hypothetical protein